MDQFRIDAIHAGNGRTPHRTILLTSAMSGALGGRNLGTSGYSYDFLVRAYRPLLERWGDVIEIRHPDSQLEPAIREARRRNTQPIHVGILPFQDILISPNAPNVVIPAWEFPDVPNYAVGGDPRKNWVDVANRCDLVLAGGPFTANALEMAGIQTPIRVVQTPTPPAYYQTPPWRSDTNSVIDCNCLVLPDNASIQNPKSKIQNQVHLPPTPPLGPWGRKALAKTRALLRAAARGAYTSVIRPCIPFFIDQALTAAARAAARSWRNPRRTCRQAARLDLSGIVYVSVFNPDDARKNWEDLLTGFLFALRDCDDATLVIKLVARSANAVNQVLSFYRQLDIAHRCKLILITDYLTDAQMHDLAAASTYYITTTRAEGMCLPLMNYLAAGRPAISPSHTAIGDYFSERAGFVVESHSEPAAWPLDRQQHWRTSWARLVWPSLVSRIRESYALAKHDSAGYAAMSSRARETMTRWCNPQEVWLRLEAALNLVGHDGDFQSIHREGALSHFAGSGEPLQKGR